MYACPYDSAENNGDYAGDDEDDDEDDNDNNDCKIIK